jgi:signal transduction histidine kinase
VLHVLTGGVLSVLTLAVPVLITIAVPAPFTGRITAGTGPPIVVPTGFASAWIPLVPVLGAMSLVYLVSGTGKLLALAAARLLGASPSDRIEELERRAGRLAERNRLARELHDSVGHALSVVTIQAGAARRILRRDPDTAESALTAIEDSARAALDDLDHVLGLLREEASGKAPQASLDELPALLSATRHAGVEVDAEVHGELGTLPPVVSREAYRIVQEALTNALRHAGKVPVTLRVAVDGEELRLAVRNPIAADSVRAKGKRRGLRGMAERVEVLRGEFRAGAEAGHWEVAVRLPWGAGT